MVKYKYQLISALFFCFLLLAGCLINRLVRIKDQLCDFDANFSVCEEEDGGLTFTAGRPILYDSDIITLTGEYPSKKTVDGDRKSFEYIFQKYTRGRIYNLSTTFRFIKVGKKYKLEALYLDRNILAVFSKKLIIDVLKSACRSKRNLLERTVIINLKDVDLTLMPTFSRINKTMGKYNNKQTLDDTIDLLTYNFDQRFIEPDQGRLFNRAVVKAYYDKKADRLVRAHVKYLRYDIDAKFNEKKVFIKTMISSKANKALYEKTISEDKKQKKK